MPHRYPGLILGFHGCDRSVADRVVLGKDHIRASRNSWDWLGHGMYFWENNSRRALEWAQTQKDHPRPGGPKIGDPAVIGAILDLGNCLNLTDNRFLALLPRAFAELERFVRDADGKMPANRPVGDSRDNLLRDLDCAVIESLHGMRADEGEPDFDSVRGVFTEGDALFPGAEIQHGNHVQICIRNPDCVLGYFVPRDL